MSTSGDYRVKENELVGVYRSVGGAVTAANYYSMERIIRKDELTGARVTQLTSFPVLNHTLYYHCPCFTPDSKTLIFLSYRGDGRVSSPDLWRVDLDGTDLRRVTNREWLAGFIISPDGKRVYAQDGGTLLSWSMEGGEPIELGHVDGVSYAATVLGSITADGKWYTSSAIMDDGSTVLVRYATDGDEAAVLLTREFLTHVQVDQSGSDRVLFGAPPDAHDGTNLWICESDGSDVRRLSLVNSTGHFGWFGKTGKVFSTVTEPFGSVVVTGEGQETCLVARGGHFWHASGSEDGRWIAADTNWPDMGVMLINTESGAWAPICMSGASHGHPQWTHPHPMLSPDARHVVINSDRTGIGQVYSIEIPEEIREQIS